MKSGLRPYTVIHRRSRRAGAPLLAVLAALLSLALLPAAASAATAWSPQTSGVTTDLDGVAFTDAASGWAVGASGTILATTDGGATWKAQTSGTNRSLYAVTFTGATSGWAVGAFGTILATTDGGATWTAQTSGVTTDLYCVTSVSATDAWAVGASGAILATTDGGATWAAKPSGTTSNLRAVTFTSATAGWAVGASGTILATTDGGATWAPQTSGTTSNLRAVAFTSATSGWAVGASGTILATTDGGATWKAQSSSTTSNLLGVAFTDAVSGWVVGYDGVILGYSKFDPITLSVTGADPDWHSEPVDLTVTAAVDDRLTLASLAYSTDGGATWTAVPGEGTSRTLTIAAEGTTSVVVRAVDSAGQTVRASATVNVDTQPTVSVSGGSSSWQNTPAALSVQASVFATHTLAALEYSRDGGATWGEVPGDGGSRTLTVTSQGTSRITVRVTDSAGAASSASAMVKIDTVKPTSKANALTLKRSQAKKGKTVSVKATLKDAAPSCGSAVLVTTISTASGHRLGRTTLAGATVNKTRTVKVKLTHALAKGTYYISTRATDKAGNVQAKAGKVKLRVK